MTEVTDIEAYERPYDQIVREAQFYEIAALTVAGIQDAKSVCALMNITRRRMDLLINDPEFEPIRKEIQTRYAEDWKLTLAEVNIDEAVRSQAIHVKGQELLAGTIDRLMKRIENDATADDKATGTTAPEFRAAIAAVKVAMEGAHAARGVGTSPSVGVQVNVPVFVPTAEQAKTLAATTRDMDSPNYKGAPGTVRVIEPPRDLRVVSQIRPTDEEVEAVLDKLRQRLGPDFDVNKAILAFSRRNGVEHRVVADIDEPEYTYDPRFEYPYDDDDELIF